MNNILIGMGIIMIITNIINIVHFKQHTNSILNMQSDLKQHITLQVENLIEYLQNDKYK